MKLTKREKRIPNDQLKVSMLNICNNMQQKFEHAQDTH